MSDFDPYEIKFFDLPTILTLPLLMYAPAQFNESKRRTINFKGFTDFIVLDFDDGWDDAHEKLFNQWIGIKIPTKSHMKLKNGIICERYRILLLLEKTIFIDSKNYKIAYRHIMRDLRIKSDTSCVDSSRFYYSAPQDISCAKILQGNKYFPFEQFIYQDLSYASLDMTGKGIDIEKYKGINFDFLDLESNKLHYPCPICRQQGYDWKGHHLRFDRDKELLTCFFDEEHTKILRKVYRYKKYGEIVGKYDGEEKPNMENLQKIIKQQNFEETERLKVNAETIIDNNQIVKFFIG
jgi:hypothetical protein